METTHTHAPEPVTPGVSAEPAAARNTAACPTCHPDSGTGGGATGNQRWSQHWPYPREQDWSASLFEQADGRQPRKERRVDPSWFQR